MCMDCACITDVLYVFVWDMNIKVSALVSVSNCCLIALTHRVKDILDHFSSLSV